MSKDDLFANKDIDFDDIIFKGSLGGLQTIEKYIETRKGFITREISRISNSGGDPSEHLIAINMLERAASLLDQVLKLQPE
ncbi:hypothetical protein FJU08_16010 [Martelella alba]|uniref:Uncharacterized protein n=1 Tax=Martelella alba TaxID=2590451 RepID=A0A506U377_9HYPH|nr:hypothetical protein [Martelella alba]TPW28832.1 hypothetical protein FJU08_16010 [Martelella alba]